MKRSDRMILSLAKLLVESRRDLRAMHRRLEEVELQAEADRNRAAQLQSDVAVLEQTVQDLTEGD